MISVRILMEGKKVQGVGYRIFLLEKALESGIDRIYARNINEDKMEFLVSDEEDKVNRFYEIVIREKPKDAVVKNIKKEPYDGKVPIPSIDRYFQFLTLEQLSRGREEVLKLPEFVSNAIGTVASALKGIDEKFGAVAQRFGVFGEYAQKMDGKLGRMDEKLSGIDEKLDTLPERIAKAMRTAEKES